jgi:hypothetical protein
MVDGRYAEHHIESVAHHFLAAVSPRSASASTAATANSRAGLACDFAVAAYSSGRLSSDAAAWLTLASLPVADAPPPSRSPLRVQLHDLGQDQEAASAGVALDRLLCAHAELGPCRLLPARPAPDPDGRSSGHWTGVEVTVGTPPIDAGTPLIRWLHLGTAGATCLERLETSARFRRSRSAGRPCRDGLVWCLQAGEAGCWRAAYALGRVMSALQPGLLKVLVFADEATGNASGATSAAGFLRQPAAGAVPEELAAQLATCRELAEVAAPDCRVEVLPVCSGRDNGGILVEPTEVARLREQFLRLVGSLKLGALAGRKVGEIEALADTGRS